MQPGVAAYSSTTPYPHDNAQQYTQSSPPPAQRQAVPERSYTLGGGGYGSNSVPAISEPQPQQDDAYYAHYRTESHLPSPYSPLPTPESSHITTSTTPAPAVGPSSGTRPLSPEQPMYEDSPPMYDDATAQPAGEWNTKRR